jgi:hypothetical protein
MGPPQSPPSLPATIVFRSIVVPTPSTPPATGAALPTTVTFVSDATKAFSSPPPAVVAVVAAHGHVRQVELVSIARDAAPLGRGIAAHGDVRQDEAPGASSRLPSCRRCCRSA